MHVALVSEHVSPILDTVGIEAEQSAAQLGRLASSLARAGTRVDVYTRRQHPDLDDEILTSDGYRVVNLSAGPERPMTEEQSIPHTSVFASSLRDHFTRRKPDVAHAHSWVSGLATVLAAGAVGVPTVVSFHGLADVEHPRSAIGGGDPAVPRAAMERKIARSADRVVASCPDEADALTQMGVARAKVSIVPTGVDLDDFDPSGPTAPRGQATCRVAMSGCDSEISTVIELLAKLEDTELVVIGGERPDSAGVARLRELAASHGMGGRIVFTGPVRHRHMSTLLRSADIFVCLSPTEAAGIVTLEAMACGLPVVAYGVGYIGDLVVDGITGRSIQPPNKRHLARELELLVRNTSRRFALGVSGSDRAQSRFSWDRVAEDTSRIYEATTTAVYSRQHPKPPIPAARRYAV
ncbi:glycosyltransferase [Rhodococcus fascians]|nr:glycosyltransferase [Rhodococcus fascians]MBY4235876.1 glycosyltransferase [Rhodococcus fascians]MBY4251567.1 glycosyltransferase [Rhodococcus fascians]MBY4267222.1 glycosyltransferase [Rhodococcus fascians]